MTFWFFGKKNNEEIGKLKSNLKYSFSNIKKDMDSVNKMVDNFKEKHDQHDKGHDHHEARLVKLEQDLAEIKEILEKTIFESPRRSERSIVHERSIAFKRSNQSFMNVQNLKNVLTPAQKRVIQLLMIAETPLEYEDIAKELKLNIITVRRHINDVKRLGFEIVERINTENNRKVFYIEKEFKKMIKAKK